MKEAFDDNAAAGEAFTRDRVYKAQARLPDPVGQGPILHDFRGFWIRTQAQRYLSGDFVCQTEADKKEPVP